MANEKPTKVTTRKHLARLERERIQTRIVTGFAIGIIVLVILLIAYGLLKDTLFLKWTPAVTVNGESLSVSEFQVRTRVSRQRLIDQYMQYYQMSQMFGISDPINNTSIGPTLQNIKTQLDDYGTIAGNVLEEMINNLLVKQYAKANGITVSDADIEKAIRDALGYFPDGTPTPTVTPTGIVYPPLDATQLALVTVTPLSEPTLAPTSLPTATLDLTSTATPVPSATFTSTPYTLKGFQGYYQDALKYYTKLGMNEEQFRRIFFEYQLYTDRVKKAVTADVSHDSEQVWARHILLADEATANSVRAQLIAGNDFATLAAAYSIDTGSKNAGGDVGWFTKGKMLAEFETAAFALQVGEISQPVKTSAGYHIIQVLGHEPRPMSESDYQSAVDAAFKTWLEDQAKAGKVTVTDKWPDYTPISPTIAQAEADQIATITAYAPTYNAQQAAKATPTP